LSFPFALVLGSGGRLGDIPAPTYGVVVSALILMTVRMCVWGFFWRNWRRAERRRQTEANRRLVALAESSRELLWETRDDHFVYLAPTVAEYLGYEPEELLGRPAAVVFADFDRPRAAALAQASRESACGWRNEPYTFRTKGGELRDFLSTGFAQTDESGKVIGFAGALRGIDELGERQQVDQLRAKIRSTIENRSMSTVFQVVIDTTSNAAVGAEALSRFPADDAMMTPERWFSAAARAGLGVELEVAAIRQALAIGASTLPRDLFLSVNVSPAAVLSGQLESIVDESGWSPAMLVLEITEHVSVEDYAELTALTTPLRRRGLRLAVDDAGAGYASFRHILALRPDYIKLDRGLIAGIDTDPGKRALVKAVTTFAGDIGATVIAEGVENASELRAAAALGAQGAQGYHICAPTAVSEWPSIYREQPIPLPARLTLR